MFAVSLLCFFVLDGQHEDRFARGAVRAGTLPQRLLRGPRQLADVLPLPPQGYPGRGPQSVVEVINVAEMICAQTSITTSVWLALRAAGSATCKLVDTEHLLVTYQSCALEALFLGLTSLRWPPALSGEYFTNTTNGRRSVPAATRAHPMRSALTRRSKLSTNSRPLLPRFISAMYLKVCVRVRQGEAGRVDELEQGAVWRVVAWHRVRQTASQRDRSQRVALFPVYTRSPSPALYLRTAQ